MSITYRLSQNPLFLYVFYFSLLHSLLMNSIVVNFWLERRKKIFSPCFCQAPISYPPWKSCWLPGKGEPVKTWILHFWSSLLICFKNCNFNKGDKNQNNIHLTNQMDRQKIINKHSKTTQWIFNIIQSL